LTARRVTLWVAILVVVAFVVASAATFIYLAWGIAGWTGLGGVIIAGVVIIALVTIAWTLRDGRGVVRRAKPIPERAGEFPIANYNGGLPVHPTPERTGSLVLPPANLRRLDMGVKVMVHGDPAQRPLRLLA